MTIVIVNESEIFQHLATDFRFKYFRQLNKFMRFMPFFIQAVIVVYNIQLFLKKTEYFKNKLFTFGLQIKLY